MKNNKGQALIEFILVLPVVLLLIMSIIDFGNIILKKYSLENDMDVIVDMYKNDDTSKINNYVVDNNLKITYGESDNMVNINLSKEINITSPMVKLVLGNKYDINTNRSIYLNEQ